MHPGYMSCVMLCLRVLTSDSAEKLQCVRLNPSKTAGSLADDTCERLIDPCHKKHDEVASSGRRDGALHAKKVKSGTT